MSKKKLKHFKNASSPDLRNAREWIRSDRFDGSCHWALESTVQYCTCCVLYDTAGKLVDAFGRERTVLDSIICGLLSFNAGYSTRLLIVLAIYY